MPIQSNSRRKRERSVRRELAPWLITSGRTPRLPVGPDVEEPRALRRADPLVAVARVVRGAESAEVERHHARARGRRRPARRRRGGQLAHEPLDRQDEAGRARHVVDQREPRPRPGPAEHRLEDLLRAASGNGTGATTTRAPARAATASTAFRQALYAWVGRQELVARSEVERAEHGVHAGRRVGHERQVVRIGPDEGAERGPRGVEALRARGSGTAPARSPAARGARPGRPAPPRGQAPNEPWFRKVTAGSSGQSRRGPSGTSWAPSSSPQGRTQRSAGWPPRRRSTASIAGRPTSAGLAATCLRRRPACGDRDRGDLPLTPRAIF